MPGLPTDLFGKDAENTRSSDLVEELHKVGLATAKFERQFRVRKRDARIVQSKPDITITNGGLHVISAKWGSKKELEAVNTADEYRANLEPELQRQGKQIGEVIAITYPSSKEENFILHLRPIEGRRDICIRLKTLPEVAIQIRSIVLGRIEDVARQEEPIFDEAQRLLHLGTREISNAIRGVPDSLLEDVWGGHDFFRSLLLPKLSGPKRREALRAGAGYLFLNQVLFYCLLAEAAQACGGEISEQWTRIDPKDYGSPDRLRELYFEKVHARDYEPIYALNIAQFLKSATAASICRDVVRSLASLAPKLTLPSLIGQVFQEFIDPVIRKKLGACYTNAKAAELLATLAIPSSDATVLDPACGSGTLLVAAYRRKAALAPTSDPSELHRRFVEHDLTGIEVMGFAAHLAAVNLALQRPLVDTDYVRIAVADSTSKRPTGEPPSGQILPWDESAPRELRQQRLDSVRPESRSRGRKRIVELSKRHARPIKLSKVRVVMMNPPFTSWHQMGRSYRESLKRSFSQERAATRQAIRGKFSQQGFFLILADLFLDPGGTVAAILPLSTFSTVAFERLNRQFLSSYSIDYVVIGFGRSAFSESSNVTECLFIARKGPPQPGHRVTFVGTHKHPNEWSAADIRGVVDVAQGLGEREAVATSLRVPQENLASGAETIVGVVHRLQPGFTAAQSLLRDTLESSPLSAVPWAALVERRKLEVHRWVLGSELFSFYGPEAVFVAGNERRARSEGSRLVGESASPTTLVVRDVKTGNRYKIPSGAVAPCIRSFANLPSIQVPDDVGLVVARDTPTLEQMMRDFYAKPIADRNLKRIRQVSAQFPEGRLSQRIRDGSARLSIGIRFNLAAPGTTVISCRSASPTFLAAYGFMVKGLSEREEKLFTLWTNSSLFLIQALSHMTLTEGTWGKFEKSFVEKVQFPDFDRLTSEDWEKVECLYEQAAESNWPSLIDQLRGPTVKSLVDDGLLKLIGVASPESRKKIGHDLRSAALSTIEALKDTMGK